MKACSKCKKTYDDSWDVCLVCGERLQGGAVAEEVRATMSQQGNEFVDIRKKTPPIKYQSFMVISIILKLLGYVFASSSRDGGLIVMLTILDIPLTALFIYGAFLWTRNKGYDGVNALGAFIPILFIPVMFFAPVRDQMDVAGQKRWSIAFSVCTVLGGLAVLAYFGNLAKIFGT